MATGTYKIGSPEGQKIANNMAAGSKYKASDGSTWTKNNDGTISVMSASGNYTPNAYQSTVSYSMPSTTTGTKGTSTMTKGGSTGTRTVNPYTPTSSTGASSVNKYNPNNSSNVVNTKQSVKPIVNVTNQKSYNGVNYDNDTDYQALINQAVNSGDYALANQYERSRNAKIQGEGLTNKYGITNNYGNMSFNDLPANWRTVNINGDDYSQQNGNIYRGDEFVGDRIVDGVLGFSRPDLVTDTAKQNFYNGQLSRDLLRYGFSINDAQNLMGSLLDTYTAQALVNGDTDDLSSAIIDGLLTQQARADEQAYYEMLYNQPTQQQDEMSQLLQQYLLMMMMQGMNLNGNYLNGNSPYAEAYQNYINQMLGFSNMNVR